MRTFLKMLAFMKRFIKWGVLKKWESPRNQETSHLLAILKGVLEDLLFWRRMWLSLSFILFLNALFFLCINKQITILEIVLYFCISYIILDAFEAWLKYKHRTTCLKRLADHDGDKLSAVIAQVKHWLQKKWVELMYLRETNHTKAFILVNLALGVVLLLGKCMGGYLLFYVLCMTICTFYKVAPPVIRIAKKIQQNAVSDSDMEFEGLIPDLTDGDIKLLSIEPEQNQLFDERQSLDYWKPDDVPIEEVSDSSENSSSLVTNLSIEKMHTLDKDVETSDSSDDEYIPIEKHKEHLHSTVEVVEPAATWSSSAYNALWNFTGAVSNMIYTTTDDRKRKRVASANSSDGFEIVDKHDFM